MSLLTLVDNRNMDNNKKIIFLSGGGTLGSVTPMLALAQDLQGHCECQFVGTEDGVEREVVTEQGLLYHSIASGKLRRYFSWWNFIDPFFVVYGILQAFYLIIKYRPRLVVSAGSFVSVGLAVAAWLCRVRIVILQLDIVPGLANRIMAKLAKRVAITLPESKKFYPKARLTGCPIRAEIRAVRQLDPVAARTSFGFDDSLPVVLVLSGGTGSIAINKLVLDNLYNLTQSCQVIHVTGKNKSSAVNQNPRYHSLELSGPAGMAKAYAAADLIVSRAGMGFITEFSYLAKPIVLLPLPQSHQEANAQYFVERNAALQLDQQKTTAWTFVSSIKNLLADKQSMTNLGSNLLKALPRESNKKFFDLIVEQMEVK